MGFLSGIVRTRGVSDYPQRATVIFGDTWVYDASDETWTQMFPATAPSPRYALAMAPVNGTDQIVLFGGEDASTVVQDDTWIYDLSDNTWTQLFPTEPPSPREFHEMTSVSGTDQIVLFGGFLVGNVDDGETWVYDASDNTWTQMSPAVSPSPRRSHAMAAVSGTDQIVLFGGVQNVGPPVIFGDTWVYDASENTWTQKSPTMSPGGRAGGHMTEVSGTDQVVMFGGSSNFGTSPDPLWVYDLGHDTWTLKSPSPSPAPQFSMGMAMVSGTDQIVLLGRLDGVTWVYDAGEDAWRQTVPWPSPRNASAMAGVRGTDQIVLFGGSSILGATGDTWVYDVSDESWTRKTTTGPSARSSHAMANVSGTDQIVLFGGTALGSLIGETWVYDLSDDTWTQKFPAVSPSPRNGHGMAAVSGTDQIVLFGGQAVGFDRVADTWVYDLSDNTWTQMFPAGPPSARTDHAMANVRGTDQIVLFGGFDGAREGDTWIYDLSENTWTQMSPTVSPSPRSGHRMANLRAANQIVLFGGFDGAFQDDTWVYDAGDDTWTQKSPTESPSARRSHAMASASGACQVVLFGGFAPNLNQETWNYNADTSGNSVDAEYIGEVMVSTKCTTCTEANVTFAANVMHPYGEDVSGPMVDFVDRDAGNAVLCSAGVGLVDAGDPSVGTAECNATLAAGSYNIGIVVRGCYSSNDLNDDRIVTVAQLAASSISGAGFLLMSDSSGLYPGDDGSKTDIGFSVEYTKDGKNLHGHLDVQVHSGGRVFRIKGTTITSLTTIGGTATFNSDAMIQDVTHPHQSHLIDGNASVQVRMTDSGTPRTADSIAITVFNTDGGVWFSSNWDGRKTVEQVLSGGNIQVK
jgi:N-acetylneuraminic acid mutarotase